jgi:hypothetical protein
MLKEGCPSAIKNCSSYFSKLIDPQVRNTLLTDIARFLSLEEEVDEPTDIIGRMTPIAEGPYKALQTHFRGAKGTPREAKTLHCYTLKNLTFSTFTRHRGNSYVLVRRPSLPSIPAQIDSILQIPTKGTFFVVRFFLKTMLEDPFQQHPVLQMSLWSQNLGQLVIVTPQDVESHFACLSFEWQGANCQGVISLSRVFNPLFSRRIDAYMPHRNIKLFPLVSASSYLFISLCCNTYNFMIAFPSSRSNQGGKEFENSHIHRSCEHSRHLSFSPVPAALQSSPQIRRRHRYKE